MKRFTYFWSLMLCPLISWAALTQQAQITLNVVAVDPLSYNVRPLPTPSSHTDQNQANNTTSGAKLPTCQKTIYFNHTPYQITALQSQIKGASSCSIDTLGHQSYGIILTDV